MQNLKVSRATTHKHTLYYIPEAELASENPLTITCNILSYRELLDLNFFIVNSMFHELFNEVVAISVTKLTNVVIDNELTHTNDVSALSYSLVKEVAEFILDKSKITVESADNLASSYDIINDKRFKTDTYNCSVCQKRGLDKVRNCGKLGEKEKDPKFYLMVGETKFTYCPIFVVDTELLSEALTCYKYYTDGFLPDPGGLYDQTEFFVTASSILTSKAKESEAKYYEDMKRKP